MDLTFTSEQQLLKDSAERYLKQRYGFADRAAQVTNAKGWDARVWADFAEFGWLGLPFSEARGGLGAGLVELAILGQAFGAALVVEPYLPSIVLCGSLVESLGSGPQHASELARLISGEQVFALAHDEAAVRIAPASRPVPIRTQAVRTQSGWSITGHKTAVLAAPSANSFLVSAALTQTTAQPDSGTALFIVPRDSAGLSGTAYAQIDGTRAGNLTLDGVPVADTQRLLGESGKSGDSGGKVSPAVDTALNVAIDRGMVFAAAQAAGSMRAALDATVAYTKTRQQFGQPLAANQVIKHRLVDMAIACEEASAITLRAALLADHESAVAAKIKVSRGARWVAEQAIQLHGGMGVTDELNIGAYFKQLLTFELQFGSARHHAQAQFAQLRQRANGGKQVATQTAKVNV